MSKISHVHRCIRAYASCHDSGGSARAGFYRDLTADEPMRKGRARALCQCLPFWLNPALPPWGGRRLPPPAGTRTVALCAFVLGDPRGVSLPTRAAVFRERDDHARGAEISFPPPPRKARVRRGTEDTDRLTPQPFREPGGAQGLVSTLAPFSLQSAHTAKPSAFGPPCMSGQLELVRSLNAIFPGIIIRYTSMPRPLAATHMKHPQVHSFA